MEGTADAIRVLRLTVLGFDWSWVAGSGFSSRVWARFQGFVL